MTIWLIELQRIEDSRTLGYLSNGKLDNPLSWDLRGCELQAKTWKKRQTAAKWAAIGNEVFAKYDFPTRFRCRPMSQEGLGFLQGDFNE